MPILLRDANNRPIVVAEEGTLVVRGGFFDEDGVAATPTAPTWTLTDTDGAVINGCEDVPITVGATYTIVLTGDDLQAAPNERPGRYLLVRWTYDSDLGLGLSGVEQITFTVADLAGVPAAP